MKNILRIICLLFLICSTYSCNNNHPVDTDRTELKFDKTKWLVKEDKDYPYRNGMLKNLIDSVTLNGIKYGDLIDLLGQPNRIDNGHLFYRVFQRRINGFPLGTKTLVIKLTTDSIVEWRKIHGQ